MTNIKQRKREQRRYVSIMLSAMLMMLFGMLMLPEAALPVNAAEDMTLIYASVPSDWESPNVWAWAEDGTTAFTAWPGEEMEADAENAGWYYLYVPSFADHVIINANGGDVQTDEQVLDGGNSWITVIDAKTVEISTEQQTTGDLPEYVETFLIHAAVEESWENPCLWAWSAPDGTNAFEAWPGKEMKAGDEGWYTAKAPTFVNSIIINGNDGDVQTEDISVDPAELWVTVDADGSYELSYVDPDKAAVENITVYVSAPADWDTPNLWAWSAPDGTNVYANWPGEALSDQGDGWLTSDIPGWVNSIIVNGNGGEIQTADISIDAGKDVWIVVSGADDAYEVYYEKPEGTADNSAVSESGGVNGAVAGGVAAVVAAAAIGGGVYISKKKKNG